MHNIKIPILNRLKKASIFLLSTILLISCSPTFDWRTIRFDNKYAHTATFPGKPSTAIKSVSLLGENHDLTLVGVQISSAQWVVGKISANNAVKAQQLAEQLASDFSQKMLVKHQQKPLKTMLNIKNTLGAFDINYSRKSDNISVENATVYARARVIWTASAAYELLVIGEPDDLTIDIADTFIRSVKFAS
jgi:hypothetical protein